MAGTYKVPAKTAKKPTDELIGRSRRSHGWFAPVIEELLEIFPKGKKLAPNLAQRAGRHERIAEIWISGRGAPDGEALARLIRSDIGDRVLLALTADVQQPWAENVRATHEISKLRKQQAESARRLEALERGLK